MCVCVCVRACVRACVSACAGVGFEECNNMTTISFEVLMHTFCCSHKTRCAHLSRWEIARNQQREKRSGTARNENMSNSLLWTKTHQLRLRTKQTNQSKDRFWETSVLRIKIIYSVLSLYQKVYSEYKVQCFVVPVLSEGRHNLEQLIQLAKWVYNSVSRSTMPQSAQLA